MAQRTDRPVLRGPSLVVVLMGVSGSGKSTVGAALAKRLGWSFLDADDFHPLSNVEKMSRGEPLDDEDRGPWLETVHDALEVRGGRGTGLVLACSALKASHRRALASGLPAVVFVHLVATEEALAARLAHRRHRFMPASLLASQVAELESPSGALTVEVDRPVSEVLEEIVTGLGLEDTGPACGP